MLQNALLEIIGLENQFVVSLRVAVLHRLYCKSVFLFIFQPKEK